MATVRIEHGSTFETLTPQEAQRLIEATRERDRPQRVRASAVLVLDANGSGTEELFTVPVGFEFEARRVTLDLDQIGDPFNALVLAGVAGRFVEYLRSGTRIEYAVPTSPQGDGRIPGVQTWGAEQGPFIMNGETFEIRATGLIAAARLTCTIEGIQKRPYSVKKQ